MKRFKPIFFVAALALSCVFLSAFAATVPPASGQLFDAATVAIADFKADKVTLSLVGEGADKSIKAEFPEGKGYPTFEFPIPAAGWDLSQFSGVQVDVKNTGTVRARLIMRVDNAGDWKKEPWQHASVLLAPGESQTLQMTFGKNSDGTAAFALDPKAIVAIKGFTANPKAGTSFSFKNLKPFKGDATPIAAPAAAPAKPIAASESLNQPPISCELFNLNGNVDLSTFPTNGTQISVEGGKLKTVYGIEKSYPNVQFPIPAGGWNLSPFAGVQIDVTNTSANPVTAILRVDNAGDWKLNPWQNVGERIEAGETKTFKAIFGKNLDGTPSYPLDPSRISGMQLFMVKPKQETTLLLSNLKAFGSAAERANVAALSHPDDRKKPVTPPAWLGQKPPVAGDWVQTLNENFEGAALNKKIWDADGSGDPLSQYINRYVKENAIVAGGVLRIRAEKKAGPHYNKVGAQTREYSTANVSSSGKWTQAYGYFECRAKLPTARGLWPAFWMMPDRGPLPNDPNNWLRHSTKNGGMEFDILEHLTEWGPGRNNVAVHWDGYAADHKSWGDGNLYFGPTPDAFHNFGMLWEPGKLTWFIDGVKKSEWTNERVGSAPGYLILCTQMGGWSTKDVDIAKLPDDFVIDYVRVWQLKERVKP